MKMIRGNFYLLLFFIILSISNDATAEAIYIKGSGATFPAKVYQKWAENYSKETGYSVVYASIGSTAGVKLIAEQQVDFGATDIPLSVSELKRLNLFQFPTLAGGIVPVINIPGVAPGAIRLSNEVLGGIFSGRIDLWSDNAIKVLNPGIELPNLRITRVVRSDGSGTTEVFVTFLKQVAPSTSSSLELVDGRTRWPGVTVSAEGSAKMASAIKNTVGAIGYISSDYIAQEGLIYVRLRNKRGEWVEPTTKSFLSAIRAGQLFSKSLDATPLIDIDGFDVWPIVTATYILVPCAPSSAERAGRALNFFYRSFLLGDNAVAGTGFAPVPTVTQARIVRLLTGFRTSTGAPINILGQNARQAPALVAKVIATD